MTLSLPQTLPGAPSEVASVPATLLRPPHPEAPATLSPRAPNPRNPLPTGPAPPPPAEGAPRSQRGPCARRWPRPASSAVPGWAAARVGPCLCGPPRPPGGGQALSRCHPGCACERASVKDAWDHWVPKPHTQSLEAMTFGSSLPVGPCPTTLSLLGQR